MWQLKMNIATFKTISDIRILFEQNMYLKLLIIAKMPFVFIDFEIKGKLKKYICDIVL